MSMPRPNAFAQFSTLVDGLILPPLQFRLSSFSSDAAQHAHQGQEQYINPSHTLQENKIRQKGRKSRRRSFTC